MSTFSPAIRDFLAAPESARRLGPYLCKEPLDKAGSAPVFRAVEEHAGHAIREVAVKVFDIGRSTSKSPQPRVVEEARALCRVQHPNVIRFHTLTTDTKRGLMGLVMELADGISVGKQLADLPPGDPSRVALAVDIGIHIASALDAAHEAGVVHCNVKPSNIMFTQGTHKLINFGIAAALASEDEDEPAPGSRRSRISLDGITPDDIGNRASVLDKATEKGATALVGSIGYVDPECLRTVTAPVASSDLYSLGATLYQCVAGDVPAVAAPKHRGETGVDAKVLTGDAPAVSLSEIAPDAPPELTKLVDALVAPAREARPKSAAAVVRSFERIRSLLAGHERQLPPIERGPFPGLDRYEAGDRDVFFGRSAEIAGVLELARTRGLVGIVGLSGTGKSSITRAGIVPAIEEGALGGWPAKYRSVLVTPGKDLMAALDAALTKVIGVPLSRHPDAIVQQLVADVDAKGEGLVILIDQLEELVMKYDRSKEKERAQALDLLTALAEAPAGLRCIVAVRRDLLDEVFAIDAQFARALARGVQLISPLTSAGWEEVIDHGLDAYDHTFEDDKLRDEVLADIRTRESAMSLIQFGLSRLWAARDTKKKKIPREAFGAKGGMRGALEQHADAAVAALDIPTSTVRDVMLALTTPEGARTHVELDELVERFGADAKKAIFAMTKARLVVSEKEGFTFLHDTILREWTVLRGWIEAARDDRQLKAQIERDAARWSASKDAALHWRKGRLAAALELWKQDVVPLSDDARSFLAASAKEMHRAQLVRWSVALLIVGIVMASSLVYARLAKNSADQARRDADALAAALADVKTLKRQAEENALEAEASGKLLQELQKQMAEERSKYGKAVQATLNKVANATSLAGAQKASEDLKATPVPSSNQVVALPSELLGAKGPSAPKIDTSGPSPSGGGGTFDQAAIERVVNSRKAGVKRTCLERSTSTASSTRVTAAITIAPNGTVQNVSTSGNDPAVGKCIENQLRTWTFPAPGETRQVQIPFVFVRQ